MSDSPLLEIRGISKHFGATTALDGVDVVAQRGRVLALIGENGAGKSTLLKTLSGAHLPDSGSMCIEGQPYRPHGPSDARRMGVAMIYQELNLAPDLSVEDNILLGQPGGAGGLLVRSRQRARVTQALDAVGLAGLDPRAIVGEQSVATQQLVEIARALASEARLILFDEPTSSLPQKDVDRLFQIIDRLKSTDIAIVYISHFLEEVRRVADEYAVLRDGRAVGAGRIEEVTDNQIISLMVGRDVDDLFPVVPHDVHEPVVQLNGLSGEQVPEAVNLDLRRGEIFGIAGLVGAGRTELLRCIFGLDHCRAGSVSVRQSIIRGNVPQRMKAGFSMLSEDRKSEGLAQDLSIEENITLSNLGRYSKWGWLNLRKRFQRTSELMTRTQIKATNAAQMVSELSGGNQQKVAIARILHEEAEVLLLDEPTKGIDVGTKAEIYRMMGQLAREGKTIVFVSSYLPELLAVCDRIGVMARGKLRAVRPAQDWTDDEILECAIGSPESGAPVESGTQ